MIDVKNVVAHYGIRPILVNTSLEIPTGKLVCVMGPNGMGKSTLLKVISGMLPPMKGKVEFDGRRRWGSNEEELSIRKDSVYLPDHPWLPLNMTGREFLLAVGKVYEVDVERMLEHIEQLLSLFCLQKVADSPVGSYSNGQQKKLAICSILLPERPYMILDEPFTGGLDPAGVLALKRVLGYLASREDVTIVMATQLAGIAEAIAERIAVIENGHIASYDTVENIKRLNGNAPTLEEALDHLFHPDTVERIEEYFDKGARR